MKFIIMTNSALNNNIVHELIISGLIPEFVVTNSPFFVKKTNLLKYVIKKCIRILKFLRKPSEIKENHKPFFLARKHSIPIYNSNNVNTKRFEKKIKDLGIDYIFTFGFRIIKENIINAPKIGCINFHPAYLPFNRGASPSNWVILRSKQKTGITFHYITKGIDKGNIIEQYEIPLSGYENSKILNRYLFGIGEFLFVQLIFRIKYNITLSQKKNDVEIGSYESPFGKSDGIISESFSAQQIDNTIKASKDENRSATFRFDEKEYEILNFIEVANNKFEVEKFPFLDQENNIYLKTENGIIILLITKKANL